MLASRREWITDTPDRQKGGGMQGAEVSWRDGDVPVSDLFDDHYFVRDGLAESRHVYLRGNGLPARFAPGFHIAELGFGTGLNALAAAQAWAEDGPGGTLRFTSFEAYPMTGADMARALARWPELDRFSRPMLAAWAAGARDIALPGVALRVVEGDARATVPRWDGGADAWFLDGFSPARNPELWDADLPEAVARHTAPGGTCATFSAAGHVRARLTAAGFAVTRSDGFGAKRHMTRGARTAQ
jgi:tRNA U34 5-methylaminomethyl-2-thiouridine-forming methyltransferase MnmC